jgi:hypothetical protein
MRILFLAPYPPSLIRVRPFNWIKHLAAQGHEITLLALVSSAQEAADLNAVCGTCCWPCLGPRFPCRQPTPAVLP